MLPWAIDSQASLACSPFGLPVGSLSRGLPPPLDPDSKSGGFAGFLISDEIIGGHDGCCPRYPLLDRQVSLLFLFVSL